jgi:dihydrofolate reductase
VRVEKGDLVETVNRLKNLPRKDIVVYGGATFVSSLIENDLIGELNIFVNPVAIGRDVAVFESRKPFALLSSTACPSASSSTATRDGPREHLQLGRSLAPRSV